MRLQLAHALLDVLLAFALLAYARGADPVCVGEGCECARWCKLPDDHCPNEACSALMCSHNGGDGGAGIGTLSAWGMPEDLPKFALYFAPVGLVFGIAAGAWAHSREQSKKKTKKQLESEFEEKRRRSGARSAGFDDDDDDDFD